MTTATAVEPGIGRIVLDRPPLNILTREMMRAIRAELTRLAEQPDLRVLLLTAAGANFSAGADVGEHLPPHHLAMIPEFLETVAALDAFPVPVVAAVRGKCLGAGFELVQAADLIIAGEGASFGQPEIALGVIPPAACVLLPNRMPRGLAAQVIYAGDPLSAAEALRWGLVARVVPDALVDHAALEDAQRLARHSAVALRAAKRVVGGAAAGARKAALLRAGDIYQHEVMETRDAVEGLAAFTEKRKPVWRHA